MNKDLDLVTFIILKDIQVGEFVLLAPSSTRDLSESEAARALVYTRNRNARLWSNLLVCYDYLFYF